MKNDETTAKEVGRNATKGIVSTTTKGNRLNKNYKTRTMVRATIYTSIFHPIIRSYWVQIISIGDYQWVWVI